MDAIQHISTQFQHSVAIFFYLGMGLQFTVKLLSLAIFGFQNHTDQSRLLDETNKLKEEIQIETSERQQVRAVENAQDTKELKPRKDQMKDQAFTITCFEVSEKTQITEESEKPKQ